MMESKHLIISRLYDWQLKPVLGRIIRDEDIVFRIVLGRAVADIVGRKISSALRLVLMLRPEGPVHHHLTDLKAPR